ncbi:MAG: clostripain-related cysteine peptidase [Promethearchaeota archaeon]
MKRTRPILLALLILMPIISPISFHGIRYSALQIQEYLFGSKSHESSRTCEISSTIALSPVGTTQDSDSRILATNGNSPRNWTILMYMCADNDLDLAAISQIIEIETEGSTQQVNVLVYVDFASATATPGSGAFTYNITQAPLGTSIRSEPLNTTLPVEPNMGDPSTLVEFIRFGQNYSEAENYLLVLWDHGSGYLGVCADETSGNDRLLPHEIAIALENETIDPIDVVTFDASFMGQLELAYEIQNGTDLIVFSENYIPQRGLPYSTILHSLNLIPNSSPLALCKEIVDRYILAYSQGGEYATYYPTGISELCLSVINTTNINNLVYWFDETVEWLLNPGVLTTNYSIISGARGATQQFAIPHFIDLWDFSNQLAFQSIDPVIQSLATNISNSVLATIAYEQSLHGVPDAIGLAINFAEYEAVPLSFLNDTRFAEFISEFHGIGETTINSVMQFEFVPLNGYLDGKNDSVYFRITVPIPTEYTIVLRPLDNYDADFDLYLYDSNQNLLVRSISLNSTETIQYSLLPDQIYYIRVISYPRSDITYGLGSVNINIVPGSPINPIIFVIIGCLIFVVFCIISLCSFFLYRYWKRRRMQRQIEPTPEPTKSEGQDSAVASTQTAFCSECGELFPDKAKYCPRCGKNFEGTDTSESSEG